MRSPQERVIAWLRWMLRRLEDVERAELFNADVRRDMNAQIERWLDSLDATRDSPDLGVHSATHTAPEWAFGPKREEFQIKDRIVRLPKALAKLMRALMSAQGTWRTAKHLAGQLGDNAKAPHAIAQAVHRLRKELRRAGLDERIIESRRGYGWRWKKTPDKG